LSSLVAEHTRACFPVFLSLSHSFSLFLSLSLSLSLSICSLVLLLLLRLLRQSKSSVIMFDTLGTLCDLLSDDVATDAHLCSALLPPLLSRWEATADSDPLLFPLFECLASVAAASKLQFQAYALPVLQRCCRLVEAVLVADATGQVTSSGFDNNSQDLRSDSFFLFSVVNMQGILICTVLVGIFVVKQIMTGRVST
jgi:hypothetical protein